MTKKSKQELSGRAFVAITKTTHLALIKFISGKPYNVGKFVDVAVQEKIESENKKDKR